MNPQSEISICLADLAMPDHASAVVELLDHYAQDPMGSGQPLAAAARGELVARLSERPDCRIFLASIGPTYVGLAICFAGFSTFQARPLLNIHDLAVHASARGRGIGRALLAAIEEDARTLNYCKLTLEVRADNHNARHLYESLGFGPRAGESSAMSFLTKNL